MDEFDIIRKNLLAGWASQADKLIFESYMRDEITTSELRRQFFVNNRIRDKDTKERITEPLLINWLWTIGYKK